MVEANALARARAVEEKVADKARGSRMYAMLPWRADGRYNGRDVARWFRTEKLAEKHALGLDGGRGVVVRKWSSLNDPDASPVAKSAAQLDAEIAEIVATRVVRSS
ncbi:MAG TPA: hypothetical protein VNZ44_12085 [Pyrinomonadaceae bacterium]|nr:hypothetical protein [Pyrinomonadaceae bacterium]